MGRYVQLKATRAGYLSRWAAQGLDPERAAAAEREADRLVENIFDEWDRTLWQGDAVPTEIADEAERYAAGEYLQRSIAGSAGGDSTNSMGAVLKREARKALEAIVERGGPMDSMGRRIGRIDADGDDGGLFVDIVR